MWEMSKYGQLVWLQQTEKESAMNERLLCSFTISRSNGNRAPALKMKTRGGNQTRPGEIAEASREEVGEQ